MPESREQYIHRLGRTGRGGTEGKGWLVLSSWESLFLQELKGLEIPVNDELHQLMESPLSVETEELLEPTRERIRNGDKVLSKSAKGAYQAFLGYYLGQMKRMKMKRKEDLVRIANEFAALSGLHEPPPLTAQMVGKMGLKGVDGLNVQAKGKDDFGGRGRKHGGGGGGGPGRARKGHSDGRRAPNADRSSRRSRR
jgi:ATP-dependent RNA helicase MSS116